MAKFNYCPPGPPKFTTYVNQGNGTNSLHGSYEISEVKQVVPILEEALSNVQETEVEFRVVRLK
jgi:hypothetical protein